jgi:hypothetical protein
MTTEASSANTKVARVIEKYALDGMGANLEAAWTDDTGSRTSLRDLADEFNEAVLETALREASVSSLNFDVSSMYEALQNSSGPETTRARRRLEREGIDVDDLTGDFVTHQAIYTYLKQERKASLPSTEENLSERKIETIEKLQGRVSAVAESTLSSVANADELDRGDYDVIVDVRTICPNCGTDAPIGELIRHGGCGCTEETESTNDG